MEKRRTGQIRTNRKDQAASRATCLRRKAPLYVLSLLAGLLLLTGCGGSGSNSAQNNQNNTAPNGVAGNWQFTMGPPSDNSFLGGLQGGFLLQQNTSVNGAAVYSIQLPATQVGGSPTICNSGSASITGTVNGQNVTLTAVAGSQTFTLTGGLSANGLTMMGTYTSTDGHGCGKAESGLNWSAVFVPTLTGSVQGNFHSVLSPKLKDQDFPVSGSLTQGQNIGASSATVTGTLNFEGYPCLTTASVNGQVSGNSLILQVIASSGSNVGQIGAAAGDTNPSPVTILSSTAGTVIQGTNGYGISTSSCVGGNVPGDVGNICLAVGNTTACTQPITLSPASLSFPVQVVQQAGVLPPVAVQVGSAPTTQTITLTNSGLSGTPLNGLSLSFNPQSGATSPFGVSDFNGLANFTEQDNCASSPGTTFSLAPQQSCSVTVTFSPQQSCPWLPSTSLGGENPEFCPFSLSASLVVNSPVSADNLTAFAVPITGMAFSAIAASVPEIDFGAEAGGERSTPQELSFTNQGNTAVQILPALNAPCVNPPVGVLTLPRPPAPGIVAGLQVVTGAITPNGSTINYNCDADLTSKLPNFQISGDDCSGTLLLPQASCSLQVAFAPQPSTALTPSLDYFLQLNTTQCNSVTTTNCEIDSGRFPVELTANLPSSLRMTPGAGLDFGVQTRGAQGNPLTITLYNDPKDPKAGTVNFTENLVKGDYTETDNCLPSLAPGNSCTITVLFQPKIVGFDPGTITITYLVGQTQTIHLRGTGQ